MKHRHLNHHTCREAGYEAPQPPRSKAGGKYPHMQPFHKVAKKEKSK